MDILFTQLDLFEEQKNVKPLTRIFDILKEKNQVHLQLLKLIENIFLTDLRIASPIQKHL